MNGVVNVNKPSGVTSHDVVHRVRRISGQKRVGHAGTLDPDATGVLLVCLGHATRLSDLLASEGKEYITSLRLGVTTSTEDASGEVLAQIDPSGITLKDLAEVCPTFVGDIQQVPPMVSAVHHNGHRLYELARRGITVEREARSIEIQSIEVLDFTQGALCSASLRICCGKGTYIRTLCADIGSALEVGGHMASLTRTRVGQFAIENSVDLDHLTLDSLLNAAVSSLEATSFLPAQELSDQSAADILNGKKILGQQHSDECTLVRLSYRAELMALARRSSDGWLLPEKVFPPSPS
jgi:tRNA pseudouridine55 synthase